jgi:hypothetical protein
VYYFSAAQFSGSMNGWKAQNLKKVKNVQTNKKLEPNKLLLARLRAGNSFF